jgi:hypothetical protein
MSDNNSVNSVNSVNSLSDSICNEIDDLIDKCEELHTDINNSVESLKNIHSLVENHQNIIVTYKNMKYDFNEVLEIIHLQSLQDINYNFSKNLLETINNCYFN